MSALDLLLLVHNSFVTLEARVGTSLVITLVAEIGTGVTLCVFFQVRFNQEGFSTGFTGKLPIICVSIHMGFES